MEAIALRDLGLRDSEDEVIFTAARDAGAVVLSKDRDFVDLLNRLGPPPQVVWITSGNTSNVRMREILTSALPQALELIRGGESLVEISDVHGR